jgi:WD40 repeat protein
MSKKEEKESIEQLIKKARKDLEAYNIDTDIHNFDIKEDYRKRFDNCELTFVVSKKLGTKKTSSKKASDNDDSKIEKFTNFQWAGEGNAYSNRLVSVTNRGDAYVFNSDNGNIICSENFGSGILNACAIEQTENQMFAVGGFDGAINLKNIVINNDRRDNETGTKKFTGHQGSVSAIQFMNTAFMISASLDSVLLLWDINSQGKIVNSYREHTSEVTCLDVNEVNGNIFATGSGDTTVKIWDIREKKACVSTFQGSDSSINCVKFLPGRLSTLAAGSEDSSIRLYDLRAVKELGNYKKDYSDNNSVNSIGFSKSGIILFASTTENNILSFWNIFGKDIPFYKYKYDKGNSNETGLLKSSINADKTKIAFINGDEIVIIK